MLDIIITATKHTTILRRRPWEEAVTLSSSAIASRIKDLCYGRRWMNSCQCRCASVGRTLHTEWWLAIVDDAICLCIFVWGVCVCTHVRVQHAVYVCDAADGDTTSHMCRKHVLHSEHNRYKSTKTQHSYGKTSPKLIHNSQTHSTSNATLQADNNRTRNSCTVYDL